MAHDAIVVGGGIGGSAAALRAAQHGLSVAWIRGDEGTAGASRARYVYNVDNMIGVHDAYTAQEYAVRAVQTIDRRRRSARRKAILAGEPQRGSP